MNGKERKGWDGMNEMREGAFLILGLSCRYESGTEGGEWRMQK